MKKAMISQPLAGMTKEEIEQTRERAIKYLEKAGYTVVNTLFTDEWYSDKSMKERGVVQIPLCFLAKSLENMSLCDTVYFCAGWEKARGCKIEHDAAFQYGLTIIHEKSRYTQEQIAAFDGSTQTYLEKREKEWASTGSKN